MCGEGKTPFSGLQGFLSGEEQSIKSQCAITQQDGEHMGLQGPVRRVPGCVWGSQSRGSWGLKDARMSAGWSSSAVEGHFRLLDKIQKQGYRGRRLDLGLGGRHLG